MNVSNRSQFSPKKPLRSRRNSSDADVECDGGFGEGHTSSNGTRGSGVDEVDGIGRTAIFNPFDIAYIIFSIISYLADVGTDIYVALNYYDRQDYYYFGFTIAFVGVPAMTVSVLSLKWYIKDQSDKHAPRISNTRWTFRILSLILFMNPIER